MDLSRVCRFKSKDTSYIFHQESFKGTVIEPGVSGKYENCSVMLFLKPIDTVEERLE
jgi:hypothetical protein